MLRWSGENEASIVSLFMPGKDPMPTAAGIIELPPVGTVVDAIWFTAVMGSNEP
jgi:hypothetical protein